jgi:PAS domain S-box-containing protein
MANIRILLVEDDGIEAMDIKKTLESFGYDIPYVADEGYDAYNKALEIMPDLVLMDIIIKGDIDGIKTAEIIKKLDIPVVYLTAHSEEATIREALKTEPYGYLLKPFESTELKLTIELAVYKSRMEKQLKKSESTYRKLLDSISEAVYVQNKTGIILDVNLGASKMYGYTREEFLNKTPEFLAAEGKNDMARTFSLINKAFNGEPQTFEWWGKRKNGELFPKEISLSKGKYFDQDVVIAIARDISSRKNVEKALNKRLMALSQPLNDASTINFHDLFNLDEIQNIQDQFSNATGVASIITQPDGTPITEPSNFTRICNNIIRQTEKGLKNCYYSDSIIGKYNPEGPTVAKCLSGGLWDAGASITVGGKHIANWMIGQVRDEEQNLDQIRFYSQEIGADVDETVEAFKEVPKMSKQHFMQIAEALFVFANQLSDIAYQNVQQARFIIDREKALDKLSLREEELRVTFDSVKDPIFMKDRNLRYLHVNPAFEDFFGIKVDHIIGKTDEELFNPLDVKRLNIGDSRVLKGEVIHEETIPIGPLNSIFDVLLSPLYSKDGRIDGVCGVARDITVRKKAEIVIKKSDERFKALIQNSNDIIRILDKNGIIIFDSPSSSRILGYPEGFFVGKNPFDFIHPEDVERIKKDLKEVYSNYNSGIPSIFRILKADGSYLFVESIAKNLTNEPGIEGIIVTTHPVQQRKEMEDALRESEEKYRTLFEESPDYTLLLGLDGTILDANNITTDMTGLIKEQLVGKNILDLSILYDEDIPFYSVKKGKLLEGKHVEPFESRFLDKNGNIHWVIVHITSVMKDDFLSSILIIASDITKRKIAENNIKSSLSEKKILLQEIHHRVKNNMQIISSLLNLQIQYVDEEEARNVLKESQNRVKSMAMIHEKLYQSNDLTRINFVDYIESLISNLFYSYNVRTSIIKSILLIDDVSLNIETAVPCGLIISEIVSNSLKYAFPNLKGGNIVVSLKAKEDEYELIVKDNGIGLPDEIDLNNLESLGLRLVKSLSDQIDGKLKINRENGTEFNIKFKELVYKKRI